MKISLQARLASFALALVLTLGTLGGIDGLAGAADMSAQWAAAFIAPSA